jgi:AraC-like DNA-binding protein
MVRIDYPHESYQRQLELFAEAVGSKKVDNRVVLPEDLGHGSFYIEQLPNSLDLLLVKFETFQDMLFIRTPTDKDLYILRLDYVEVQQPHVVELDGESFESAKGFKSVWLTHTSRRMATRVGKGTAVKGVAIMFSKEWLKTYFSIEKLTSNIEAYLNMNIEAMTYEALDPEYEKLMDEMLAAVFESNLKRMILQNRAMLLIERFFTRLGQKMEHVKTSHNLSNEDVARIAKVEEALMQSVSQDPPSIESLAKLAAMSSTKLKKTFKMIYGIPPYQFYQKCRMEKAKAMLLTGKYSVKEVGMEVGYSNLSNFAKAFRLVHNCLPSDFL